MLTTDKTSCQILSELLHLHGVKDVVISPGSRNTPIILALDANINIKKRVVIDERSAAYIALGMSISSGSPTAIVCTSGTALLNYAPAVAEAYYQGIPLIVISADRPMQWIDQDDSQTIRQFEALSNFVKKSYDIPDFDASNTELEWYTNRVINDALLIANHGRKGPVHINIQLNQPLSNLVDIEHGKQRKIVSVDTNTIVDEIQLTKIFNDIYDKKILIIGGFNTKNDSLNDTIQKLSLYSNIVVLTETISNINGEKIITNIDRLLAPLSEEDQMILKPDIVISFGGALVSRYVKQFLRKFQPEKHYSVGYSHTTIDCFKSLTDKIEVQPNLFFIQMLNCFENSKGNNNSYYQIWNKFNAKSILSHHRYIDDCPWSDLKAFSTIAQVINKTNNKFTISLSNGTPIRYFQLFSEFIYEGCYCNRGVSGIDGCTSTSIGVSLNNNKKLSNLLITGDMSFSYDIGALATHFIPENFKIIVLNNSGGGIFRFISSTANLSQLETYFSVKPNMDIEFIAKAYGFEYYKSSSEGELREHLFGFFSNNHKSILEIVTPPEVSGEILRQYMNRN